MGPLNFRHKNEKIGCPRFANLGRVLQISAEFCENAVFKSVQICKTWPLDRVLKTWLSKTALVHAHVHNLRM